MQDGIRISLHDQRLYRVAGGDVVRAYPVSTARNGPGQLDGSECTPLGRHVVRAKIGAGLPPRAVLAGRRFTGEIFEQSMLERFPERDWILSRILWLSGVERGVNRLGNVDTMRRYIYIHGAPPSAPMGVAASHGCVRMRNADVIELFDEVAAGTPVEIVEHRLYVL